jgi:hypothetical protein
MTSPAPSLTQLRNNAEAARALRKAIAVQRDSREVPLSHYRLEKSGTKTKRVPPAGKAFRNKDRHFKPALARILNSHPQQLTATLHAATTWSNAARMAAELHERTTAQWLRKAGLAYTLSDD